MRPSLDAAAQLRYHDFVVDHYQLVHEPIRQGKFWSSSRRIAISDSAQHLSRYSVHQGSKGWPSQSDDPFHLPSLSIQKFQETASPLVPKIGAPFPLPSIGWPCEKPASRLLTAAPRVVEANNTLAVILWSFMIMGREQFCQERKDFSFKNAVDGTRYALCMLLRP